MGDEDVIILRTDSNVITYGSITFGGADNFVFIQKYIHIHDYDDKL